MALHRALHLGSGQFDFTGQTIVITFNRSLANWMTAVLQGDAERVDVKTSHEWAWDVLEDAGHDRSAYLANAQLMNSLRTRAVTIKRNDPSNPIFRDRTPRFFLDELAWLDALGVESVGQYVDMTRTGRGTATLLRDDRPAVWELRELYWQLRADEGYEFDLNDIAGRVLALSATSGSSLFEHAVIDEGQDLSPQMLRAIAHATPDSGSVTYFGDPTQQIYGRLPSWRSAGLNITREWAFQWNYRNTREIAQLGSEIARDLEDVALGDLPERSGSKPVRIGFSSNADEVSAIAERATAAASAGRSVAVLSRKGTRSRHVADSVTAPATMLSRTTRIFEPGTVYYGTVYSAKGLEFGSVFVVGLEEDVWPDQGLIASTDEEVASYQDRKLLYVAVTRARDHLTLSYAGEATGILPQNAELYA